MSDTHRQQPSSRALEDELDRGELSELPPNQPKGILGETGFDVYKIEEFDADLNSGISLENDLPVMWLGIILAYLLFFPLAYWLLWRTPLMPRRSKVIVGAVGAVGLLAVGLALALG